MGCFYTGHVVFPKVLMRKMSHSRTVIVSGAAGFIGSQLVDALLARGMCVLGIDNFDDGYDPELKKGNLARGLMNPRFRLVQLDVRNESAMRELVAGSGALMFFHLAALAGFALCRQNPRKAWDVSVQGTRIVADACLMASLPMILVSSASVYAGMGRDGSVETDPLLSSVDSYVAGKRAAEEIVHRKSAETGLRGLILRLASTYGPRQRPGSGLERFVRQLQGNRPVGVYPHRAGFRELLFVEDCVGALIRCLDWRGEGLDVLNIGSGRGTMMRELVGLCARELGIAGEIREIPAPEGCMDIPVMNSDKARRIIGFEPRVDLECGVRRYLSWLVQTRSGGSR